MPARGNRVSKHSYASSDDPGPPCSRRTLRSGLLPTRLVQTWNSPLAVLTGILRAPPESTSRESQVEVSKYDAGGLVIADKLAHDIAVMRGASGIFGRHVDTDGSGLMVGSVAGGAAEFEAKLVSFVRDNRLYGAAAGVVQGDELVWSGGAGFADLAA